MSSYQDPQSPFVRNCRAMWSTITVHLAAYPDLYLSWALMLTVVLLYQLLQTQ